MRIFVQPRNGDSFKRVVRQAVDILREAEIASAQADESAVLVDQGICPMLCQR
jgi:hypothetical protein